MFYYIKFLSTKCYKISKYFLVEIKEKSSYHFIGTSEYYVPSTMLDPQ